MIPRNISLQRWKKRCARTHTRKAFQKNGHFGVELIDHTDQYNLKRRWQVEEGGVEKIYWLNFNARNQTE